MQNMTDAEMRQAYLKFLTKYIANFWKDIKLAQTPEEAVFRYVDLMNSRVVSHMSKRKVFNREELRLLMLLSDTLDYYYSLNYSSQPWREFTEDEATTIRILFKMIKDRILDKENS